MTAIELQISDVVRGSCQLSVTPDAVTGDGHGGSSVTITRNAERTLELRWTAARCVHCDCDLSNEVVWRVRAWLPPEERPRSLAHMFVVPVCERCARDVRSWGIRFQVQAQPPRPRVTCGRLVVQTEQRPRHNVCCERCAIPAQEAGRRRPLPQRHEATCELCGVEFTQERSDARYCSNACRQAAYRERKREEATAT